WSADVCSSDLGASKRDVEKEYSELSALSRILMKKDTAIDKDFFDIIEKASIAIGRGHQKDTIKSIGSLISASGISAADKIFILKILSFATTLAEKDESARVEEILKHIGFLQIILEKKCPFGKQELREMLEILSSEELSEQALRRLGELQKVAPRIND